MKLSNLKIGTRLSGAFAVLLLLLGTMLFSALWQLDRIDAAKAEDGADELQSQARCRLARRHRHE